MFRQGKGYAHGKVILIGEHAVVYNYEAIAIPIHTAKIEATVSMSDITSIHSSLYKGLLEHSPKSLLPIKKLIEKLQENLALPELHIQIDSSIQPHAGMGSSAAVAGAIVEAVYDYAELPLTKETRFDWVQFSDTIAHTNPSGIDALITASNDAIVFKKGSIPKYFPFELDAYLVIGYSGIEGETKLAVEHVANHYSDDKTRKLLDDIGNLSKNVILKLQTNQPASIGEDLNKAHNHLKALGLSIDRLDEMVEVALNNQAYGAKMTGGGLGGCVLALTPTKAIADHIATLWQTTTQESVWVLDLHKG
jgi:mevalonate kinase